MKPLMIVLALLLALLPVAASADALYLPSLQNGPRDWFTVADVVAWRNANNNVMPISCTAFTAQPELLFTSCAVSQAQPLTLVWSNTQGKVVAQ